MDSSIIVLYENKKLIIQTSEIIQQGQLKVVDRNDTDDVLFTHDISKTDFMSIAAELPTGKLQIQIVTPQKTMIKNITNNRR